MSQTDSDTEVTYRVVVNDEEQYSIWPVHRENAPGWRNAGSAGTKDECLAYVKKVWTDMRPLSLRKQMEEPFPSEPSPASTHWRNLVERLSEGAHSVSVSRLSESNAAALKKRIDLGYVHITFPDTSGGTELGVRLDPDSVDLSRANFADGTGTVHLEGGLTLDYREARLVADIDLGTLRGTGRLVPLAQP